MSKEKYLIYKLGGPKEKLTDTPSSEPRSTPDPSIERKDQMPGSPLENAKRLAYQMIDDVFGQENRETVLNAMDPKVLTFVVNDLKDYSALKYKGAYTEFGNIFLIFDRIGQNQELKMRFYTVFYITEKDFRKLLALTKAQSVDNKALEDRANRYIDGPIIKLILDYGPDDVPDDVLDRILKTDLVGDVRKKLIESYKRKKPYLITTISKGFKLETNAPKDLALPDKEYDMEKFWKEIKLLNKDLFGNEKNNVPRVLTDEDFRTEYSEFKRIETKYGSILVGNINIPREELPKVRNELLASMQLIVTKEPRFKQFFEAITSTLQEQLRLSESGTYSSFADLMDDPKIKPLTAAKTKVLLGLYNSDDESLRSTYRIFCKYESYLWEVYKPMISDNFAK